MDQSINQSTKSTNNTVRAISNEEWNRTNEHLGNTEKARRAWENISLVKASNRTKKQWVDFIRSAFFSQGDIFSLDPAELVQTQLVSFYFSYPMPFYPNTIVLKHPPQ